MICMIVKHICADQKHWWR